MKNLRLSGRRQLANLRRASNNSISLSTHPSIGKVLASLSQNPRSSCLSRRVWIILEHAMKHMRHFGRATPAREALQTRALIADINRVVQILDSDIAAEEERAQIFDRSQGEYPMLARTLAARRDNLVGTIALLEERLSTLQA